MRVERLCVLCFLLLAVSLGQACGRGGGESLSSGRDGSNAGTEGRVQDYSAPDGAFTIKIPGGWKVKREDADGAWMTVFHSDEARPLYLTILTSKATPAKTDSPDLKSTMLVESSKPFFQGWVNALKEQARVEGEGRIYPTRFDNRDAMRLDVTYYKGDQDDPRKGYGVYFIGDRTTFFLTLTGRQAAFAELEKILNTLRIEP